MTTRTHYLIIDLRDGSARTVRRKPEPVFGFVTYRLVVNVPDGWAKVLGDIELQLPEAPEGDISVELADA
jgi:hypothetical protein